MVDRGGSRLSHLDKIHIAAKCGLLMMLQQQLHSGVNIDQQDHDGNTPLHLAAIHGLKETSRVLLENGATVHIHNQSGRTPLECAETRGHDQVVKMLIMEFLAFLLKNERMFSEPDIQEFISFGDPSKMFHLKQRFNGKSLVEYILDQGQCMTKDRENLIEFLIKINQFYIPGEDLQKRECRVIEQLKCGVSSSKELSSCIESVQEKFPMTQAKMWSLRFTSLLINIILGWGLYISDFWTDFKFSSELRNDHDKDHLVVNGSQEACKALPDFSEDALQHCSKQFNEKWLSSECNSSDFVLESDQRHVASAILISHCFLPWILAFIFWLIILFKWRNRKSFVQFPVTILSKFSLTISQWKFYKCCTKSDQKMKEDLKDKMKIQQQCIVLSLLLEASYEAGFQFWFQTIYYLPVLIGHFLSLNSLQDIVNWRTASIGLSFISFAWASCAIR